MMATLEGLLGTFHFLRPQMLWLALLLPGVWGLWRWRMRLASPWHGVVDPHLQPHVLEDTGGGRGRGPIVWVLLSTLGVFALAGPAWREVPQATWRSEAPLVLVLDLSSRAWSTDLEPDRLTRVRLKLARLIQLRQGGQLGLVVFAGDAHTVAPITRDAGTLRIFLDALSPELMPADGDALAAGIAHALDLLERAGHARGHVLVLGGHADRDAIEAARHAARAGHRVSALGVGSETGGPVRLSGGGFASDAAGRVVIARLDPGSLRELAEAGLGRYRSISVDDSDLAALDLLDPDAGDTAWTDAGSTRWRDEGPWLVLVMLPLLLLGFRRGALAVLAVCLWLPPQPAQARDLQWLWKRDEQRAHRALQDGDLERARELAGDPLRIGAAAYRQGDFDAAADAFGRHDSASAHYNRGNALAEARRYDDALDAYREALARDPGLDDARANLEAVERWLQAQPPTPQSDGGQGEHDEDEPGEDEPSPQDGSEPASGQGEPSEAEGEDGGGEETAAEPFPGTPGSDRDDGEGDVDPPEAREDGADAESDAIAEQAVHEAIEQALQAQGPETESPGDVPDEDAEALDDEQRQVSEQWLRRVQDDPGGLLRRKFMIEHQRRQQRGGGQR